MNTINKLKIPFVLCFILASVLLASCDDDAEENVAIPQLDFMYPEKGYSGDTIMLKGNHFSAFTIDHVITVDDTMAIEFSLVGDGAIQFRIPQTLTPGKHNVTVAVRGKVSNAKAFEVLRVAPEPPQPPEPEPDRYLFYIEEYTNSVYRVYLNDPTKAPVMVYQGDQTFSMTVSAIATDPVNDVLYVMEYQYSPARTVIYRLTYGGKPDGDGIVFDRPERYTSYEMTYADNRLYWTNAGTGVYSVKANGTDVKSLYTGLKSAFGIVAGSQYLYWVETDISQVFRGSVNGASGGQPVGFFPGDKGLFQQAYGLGVVNNTLMIANTTNILAGAIDGSGQLRELIAPRTDIYYRYIATDDDADKLYMVHNVLPDFMDCAIESADPDGQNIQQVAVIKEASVKNMVIGY